MSELIYLARRPYISFLEAYEYFGWRTAFAIWTSIWRDFFTVLTMYFWGVQGAAGGYLVGEIIIIFSILFCLIFIFGKAKRLLKLKKIDTFRKVLNSIFSNTRSNYVSGVLNTGYKELQKIILGEFVGDAGVGFYSIALKFQKFFGFMVAPVKTYLFPRFVSKWNQAKEEFFYTLRKYFYQIGSASFGLVVFLSLVTPWLLPFLYGSEYLPAVSLVWILLPAFALNNLFGVFNNMTFVISRQRALITRSLVRFLVGIPATLILVYWLDYYGAAWAHAVTFYSIILYQGYFFYRHFKWRWIVPAD